MKLIKVSYEMPDGKSLTAGILATTKERAVDYLYTILGTGIRVHTISIVHDIHAIDEEIRNAIINGSSRVKRYKERIKKLNEENSNNEYEIELLQEKIDSFQQKPEVSSKDIRDAMRENTQKVYVCPYCEYETKTKQGIKAHISKKHKEK